MSLQAAKGEVAVLVTCGSAEEAQRIARAAVERRLAACVNILGAAVQSVYRWKAKVERAEEHLLLMKTTRARLAALEAEVRRIHSYEVPEFIALEVTAGSKKYLAWMSESVAPRGSRSRK
jgi:periplasmic divalent cation tolerance protein